jgi:hypothetical protein
MMKKEKRRRRKNYKRITKMMKKLNKNEFLGLVRKLRRTLGLKL